MNRAKSVFSSNRESKFDTVLEYLQGTSSPLNGLSRSLLLILQTFVTLIFKKKVFLIRLI